MVIALILLIIYYVCFWVISVKTEEHAFFKRLYITLISPFVVLFVFPVLLMYAKLKDKKPANTLN